MRSSAVESEDGGFSVMKGWLRTLLLLLGGGGLLALACFGFLRHVC